MKQAHPRVEFRLFSLGNSNAKGLLPPEGTILFQYLGFPRDLEDCTCIPVGPVAFLSRSGETRFDAQWYRRTQEIRREDLPDDVSDSVKVKDHICHPLRADPDRYLLSALHVDGRGIQAVILQGKVLRFSRLGHMVELDLGHVPDDQRFTLAVEWSYHHIEARVTWLEGDGLDQYFSGRGVLHDQFLDYTPPRVGRVVQFKARTEFDVCLLPAEVARAIWRESKEAIRDTDQSGIPDQALEAPRKVYSNGNDFLKTILNVFTEIQNILRRTKPHSFWDKKEPKREPESGAALRLLFEAICAYKNIRVYQEDPSRSGDIDFVFSGISTDMEHLELILEIKNAHSGRLNRGLTHQIPQYLKDRRSDYAVYGVLWYKGEHFDQPSDATIDDCLERLRKLKPDEVCHIAMFDVSFPVQASRL